MFNLIGLGMSVGLWVDLDSRLKYKRVICLIGKGKRGRADSALYKYLIYESINIIIVIRIHY